MRDPTPLRRTLTWWFESLGGHKPPITDDPQCGYYWRRFVRGGPRVPVRIYLRQETDADGALTGDEKITAQEGLTTNVDPLTCWLSVCTNPITYSEWRTMMAELGWSQQREGEPLATPHKPVDLLKVKLPTLKGTTT